MGEAGSSTRGRRGQALEQEGTAELDEVKRSEQSDRELAVGCTWGHRCGQSSLQCLSSDFCFLGCFVLYCFVVDRASHPVAQADLTLSMMLLFQPPGC